MPRFFPNKPTYHLIAPRVSAAQLNDDALGRALETLDAYGVTELYSLIAATAAKRLALCPTYAHLDRTSFHVDGRYNCDDPPSEPVVHLTKGDSRDHRPDLTQVMLELIVAHQAGIPVLMKPLRGHSSDATDVGQTVSEPITQLQTTDGMTYVVADSALSSEDNLGQLRDTHAKWITRVPATLSDVHIALSQVEPDTMSPVKTGDRDQTLRSTYGHVPQRWLLIYAELRRLQAQRTVSKRWLKHSEQEAHAFQKLCRTDVACAADALQAVTTFAHGWQTTALQPVSIRRVPRYAKPGRPQNGAVPTNMCYHIAGALASPLAAHEHLVVHASCCMLATNALAATLLPPLECFAAYHGQPQAERGFRFLKNPEFLASSRYLNKAERIMALLMGMTVCVLVYAALEDRIRTALRDHAATFPDQQGQRIQQPTARWVLHYFVGMHWLRHSASPS